MAQSVPLDLRIPGLEDAMLLGRGGFAVVYRAYQPAFRRTVAVKVVSVTHVDELTRERFRRECQAMGLLSEHPSIVTVLEAGFLDDGRPFLVMAYMPEGSLQDRLRQGPLGWQEAARIGVKLAGALGTAHQAGVLHRDVKPANVLVSQYGEPQLADFGIARVAGGQETSSGVITASLSYAPPEIIDGQRPSVASDVYSLGATLHALMSGSAPFWKDREDSVAALLNRVMTHPPPDLREHGVPTNIAEVLMQAMAKDPQDRPTSAAQFGRLLRLAEDENGLRPTQMTVYKPAAEPPSVTAPTEPPPTEMAPAVEDSEEFADSPTDVVDTDEMLTGTATAASFTESPPGDEEATGGLDEDIRGTPPDEVAPVVESTAVPPAAEPMAEEPELAPTATIAAAATPAAPPEATVDLERKSQVEEESEPEDFGHRRGVWIAVAAFVALTALIGGYLLTRGGDESEAATTTTLRDTTVASTDRSEEFVPPPWWAEDPVLSQAVLLDSDSHDTRDYAQVREDGASVPGRWETTIPPNWSPDYDSGWMTIALGEDEALDASGSNSIESKSMSRHPGAEVSTFAAVFRISVPEPAAAFQISLAGTSQPHRGFGLQSIGNGQVAPFTVSGVDSEVTPEPEGPIVLEPGVSYDLALVAKGNGVLHFAVWPSENTSASWDEIAGATIDMGDDWLPDGWSAEIAVFRGGSVSIGEYWAFQLPDVVDADAASSFDFPEWWLADPDWSRARLVDHATHDRYNFVQGDSYGESVWYAFAPPDWGPGFGDGFMTVATGRGETDYGGNAIPSKRLWRAPTTATNKYAAVFRLAVNEFGDRAQVFMESGSHGAGSLHNVTLEVEASGGVHAFATTGSGDDVRFDFERQITLEPGTWYDMALFAEGGGAFDLRVWPTGESPISLDQVAGVRLDLGEGWATTDGWDPGMDVMPGTSVSVDEYWGFELPGGDPATAMVNIGIVYDSGGRADQSYNQAAATGLDRAVGELGVRSFEATANEDGSNREELVLQQAQQADLVFAVGVAFADAVRAAAEAYPDVSFAILDDVSVELPNASNLVFAEEEGSYLVGVAAGLKTTDLRVGFIGGADWDLIQRFEAGYTAGVQGVNPSIPVDVEYLSQWPDSSGFVDPELAREAALSMYEGGADVIYHVAGGSGEGVFQAAREHSQATGSKVWAIGVDSDQYLTADEATRPYILTSMIKRLDIAVFNTVQGFLDGSFTAGPLRFDLANDGVDYATSGGFIDDIIDPLEVYRAQINNGTIQVPDTP